MFKRQLLRQARATRAVRAAPASRSSWSCGAAQRAPPTYRLPLLASSICRDFLSRGYASAAAAQAEPHDKTGGLVTRFADLASKGVSDNLIRAITMDMRYETMTDVQAKSINPALSGKDIVAQARTGTGKTIGFLLPTISRIIQDDPSLAVRGPRGTSQARSNDIRAIMISPTRELAEQIGEEARRLCRHTGVIVQTAVGGMNKGMMLRRTRMEGCHLLVGTPGRLKDLLEDQYSGIDAPNLTALCLDEADRMLDVGFDRELRDIVMALPDRKVKPRQTLLFSATIPQNVVALARTYIDPKNFEFVQTINPNEAPTHEKVPQHIVPVPGFEHWIPAMLELVEKAQAGEHGPEPFKAICFFNNTVIVQLVHALFDILPRSRPSLPPVWGIHSMLDQRERTRAADNFRQSESGILISTDVTARGMDFPNVTHVLQFGCPPARDQYIHRIGRTGRANKTGQAWLFLLKDEIPSARQVLPGLPIKRNDTLDVPKVSTETTPEEALPEEFKIVGEAMRRVPKGLIAGSYVKLINDKHRAIMQLMIDAANRWVLSQGGMTTQPLVPTRIASQMRGARNITIGDGPNRGGDDGGFGGFGDRGGGGGFGDRGGGGGYGGRDGPTSYWASGRGDSLGGMSREARDDRAPRNARPAF